MSDILFYESHAAAQSLRNGWTRLASTYDCMLVVLSPEMLTIKPHRFARWMINILDLDLNHEIPISDIRQARVVGSWFGHGKVEVQFVAPDRQERSVLLYLKKHRDFIAAIRDALNSREREKVLV